MRFKKIDLNERVLVISLKNAFTVLFRVQTAKIITVIEINKNILSIIDRLMNEKVEFV